MNFDPGKYLAELEKDRGRMMELFTPTEHGFILDGFVYDRRAITPEQRAWMLDALKQAVHELEADSGTKKPSAEDFLKILP